MSAYTQYIRDYMATLLMQFCQPKFQVYDSGVVVIEYTWTDADAKQEYETLEEIRRLNDLAEGRGRISPCYP